MSEHEVTLRVYFLDGKEVGAHEGERLLEHVIDLDLLGVPHLPFTVQEVECYCHRIQYGAGPIETVEEPDCPYHLTHTQQGEPK